MTVVPEIVTSLFLKCIKAAIVAMDDASIRFPESSSTCTSTRTLQAFDPDMMHRASVSMARASFSVRSRTLLISIASSEGRVA